jgi:hypothetical protein
VGILLFALCRARRKALVFIGNLQRGGLGDKTVKL